MKILYLGLYFLERRKQQDDADKFQNKLWVYCGAAALGDGGDDFYSVPAWNVHNQPGLL